MPQRQLVDEVRATLDDICDRYLAYNVACGRQACVIGHHRLLTLRNQNPQSLYSTKVIRNIGKYRLARLVHAVGLPEDDARAAVVRAALPSRREPQALVAGS